jgi:hypothetical protein
MWLSVRLMAEMVPASADRTGYRPAVRHPRRLGMANRTSVTDNPATTVGPGTHGRRAVGRADWGSP